MIFKDKEHEDFYNLNIERTNSFNDPYRKALFYTLGLTEETRNNIDSLYSFKWREINFDGLRQGWQTGTSMRITRLAFNLYNGFCGDTDDEEYKYDSRNYTPYYLFDTGMLPYMLEAIKLRYQEYMNE